MSEGKTLMNRGKTLGTKDLRDHKEDLGGDRREVGRLCLGLRQCQLSDFRVLEIGRASFKYKKKKGQVKSNQPPAGSRKKVVFLLIDIYQPMTNICFSKKHEICLLAYLTLSSAFYSATIFSHSTIYIYGFAFTPWGPRINCRYQFIFISTILYLHT